MIFKNIKGIAFARIFFLVAVFSFISLNTNKVFAAAPSISTGVLQNSSSTTVDVYLTGSNFNSFVHTTGYIADPTDLAKISYNGTTSVSAVIVEEGTTKRLTASFPILIGTAKSGGSLTISAGTIKNATTQNGLITLVDGNITDSAKPILFEVTPVPDGNDPTPDYTFNSSEAGTINYAGDCTSGTGSAVVGNNTITLDQLSESTHSNCTIIVTDSLNNVSTALNITPFTVQSGVYTAEFWNLSGGTSMPPAFPESLPDVTTTVPAVNFSWGDGAPIGGIGAESFTSRFTKTVYFPANTYYFSVTYADDGVRVFLDDVSIISAWQDQGSYSETVYRTLTAGLHTIRVEHYENSGGAGVQFTYGTVSSPILTVITPVTNPIAENGPLDFTFHSDQTGSLTYGGSCFSGSSSVGVGDNTITLNSLPVGVYNDCTVTVLGQFELSSTLNVPSFEVVASPTVVYVDDDYASDGANDGHTWDVDAFDNIQNAVSAVATGGTVNVAVGGYINSNTIVLNRAVNLVGAGPGLMDGSFVAEINCDYVFSIENSDVHISGFSIMESSISFDFCYNRPAIRVVNDFGTTTVGTIISNNEIMGGKKGLILRGDSASSTVVQNNFHDNSEDGIVLASSKYNLIDGNTITDNYYGIDFWSGDCGPTCDGNPSFNIVRNNTIEFNSYNGIIISNGSDNLITANYIDNNYDDGIYIYLVWPEPTEGHGNTIDANFIYQNGAGLQNTDPGTSGVNVALGNYTNITNNIISDNFTNGITIGYLGVSNFLTITGNTIGSSTINDVSYVGQSDSGIKVINGQDEQVRHNTISGNTSGIVNNTSSVLDATQNWWGDASGPYQASTNPSGLGNSVSDYVIYNPFLNAPYSPATIDILYPRDGGESKMATPIIVSTAEQATCYYSLDSSDFTQIAKTNSTIHTDNLVGLASGSHTLVARCDSGSGDDYATSTWTKLDVGNEVLYGVNGAGNYATPHLLLINPETGSTTRDIGPTGHNITGLAIDPITGIMYGTTGGQDQGGNTDSVFIISTTTGEATLLGLTNDDSSNSYRMADIAFSSDGTLYGWGEPEVDSLFTIDLNTCNGETCHVTEVGPSGLSTGGSGLAITSDARFYQFGNGENRFYRINSLDGSVIQNITVNNPDNIGYNIAAAAADSLDRITIAGHTEGGNYAELFQVDEVNGVYASLGGQNPDMSHMDALVFGYVAPTSDDIYVDDDYAFDGPNDGHTWGTNAFDNIYDAVDAADANGSTTIHVAPGAYFTPDQIVLNKKVAIVGPGKDQEFVASVNHYGCDKGTFAIIHDDVTVTGLVINEDGCGGPAIVVESSLDGQNTVGIIHGVVLTDNEINGGYRGIILRGDSASSTVIGNDIHDTETAIRLPSSKGNLISGNSLHDNNTGLSLAGGDCSIYCDGAPDNNTISNNEIYNNSSSGIFAERGSYNTFSSNNIYQNNLSGDFPSGGIFFNRYFDNVMQGNVVTSNSVHDNTLFGIFAYFDDQVSSEHPNIISNNSIFDNGVESPDPNSTGLVVVGNYTQVTGNKISNNINGIVLGGFGQADYLTVTGNTIGSANFGIVGDKPGNSGTGITIVESLSTVINGNIISGNGVGAESYGDPSIDISDNYWGSETGPTNITNPFGTGDIIGGIRDLLYFSNVDYLGQTTATFSAQQFDGLRGMMYRPFYTDSSLTTLNNDGNLLFTVTTRGFEYGLDINYGATTTDTSTDFSPGEFSEPISLLTCDTTYHYRAYINGPRLGTIYTDDNTFTTNSCDGPDTDGPGVLNLNIDPLSSQTGITFDTNENASFHVIYSADDSFDSMTDEVDAESKGIEHSSTLVDLLPCTQYKMKIVSVDQSENISTSTSRTFVTKGCSGDVNPLSITTQKIMLDTDNILDLSEDGNTLIVKTFGPFASTTSSVTIQIKAMAGTTTLDSIGKPNDSMNSIGGIVFDVKAIINASTTLDSFDAPVTIIYNYSDSDVAGVDESSLKLYHYHNGQWLPLDNCVVDAHANTITCTTLSFSVFALFSQPAVAQAPQSDNTVIPIRVSSGKGIHYGCKDIKASNYESFASSDPSLCKYVNNFKFARGLRLGMKGDDVKNLQKFLNSRGYIISKTGPGSVNNETVLFGGATKKALVKFQKDNKISPASGFMGDITKGIINSYVK